MGKDNINFPNEILTETPTRSPYLRAIWRFISGTLSPLDSSGDPASIGNLGNATTRWRSITARQLTLSTDAGIFNATTDLIFDPPNNSENLTTVSLSRSYSRMIAFISVYQTVFTDQYSVTSVIDITSTSPFSSFIIGRINRVHRSFSIILNLPVVNPGGAVLSLANESNTNNSSNHITVIYFPIKT